MQSVPEIRSALVRVQAARALTGDGNGTFYAKIAAGLMTKPVKIGLRAAAIPAHEIEAINRARIAGKSDDDIRKLVHSLHEQRKVEA